MQRRTIAVLSGAQIVSGMGISVTLALSSLVVHELSGSTALSGLAGTAVVLGAALFALPTASVSGRGGRRAGLALAYGAAFTGSVVAVGAIAIGSWPLLLLALVLIGGGIAGNLSARYAATDLAPEGHAARHLSWVLWATTIGTVAGPNLAQPASALGLRFGLADAAGPFAVAALTFAIAAIILGIGLRPDPLLLARAVARADLAESGPPERITARAAWASLKVVPAARLALLGIAVSHTAMVSIMSMTPVHLDQGHVHLTVIGVVISLHIAGMYMLAPLVGWLADRAGTLPVLMSAMVILLAAAGLAGAGGHDVALVSAGLFLLGVGWSCGLIAGSAMLSQALTLEFRPAAQGLSDLVMNICGAGGALLAGAAMGATSYRVLAGLVAIMVSLTALAIVRTRPRARSVAFGS